MRTYGRTTDVYGNKTWVEVQTDSSGNDDYVWVTTLCQCLLLNYGESPFYATHGIPAQRSLIQQIFPDFYVYQTQQQFSGYFANLTISKENTSDPTYDVKIITNQGVQIAESIPV